MNRSQRANPPNPSAPPAPRNAPAAFVRLLRPRQWTKNALVFAALLFSHALNDPASVARAAGAFVVFCALSGASYAFNDLHDVERDRMHPEKRHRPLASGAIRPQTAWPLAALLAAGALGFAAWLSGPFFLVSLLYFLVVGAYSFVLKQLVVLDVMVIALGFVLRALAGAVVLGVTFSPWLLLCTLLLALFLALAKRRHELVLLGRHAGAHRAVLDDYSLPLLDSLISIVTAGTVVGYALYSILAVDCVWFIGSILPVLYGLFRYLYLVYRQDGGGSPEEVLLQDTPLIAAVVVWGLYVLVALYGC